MNIYVIDLIYKIQVASRLELLTEQEKENLHISNYGFFEFLKDENSPKDHTKFKLPIYISVLLHVEQEWLSTINNYIIPLIKKYEGKLLCNEPIKPKPVTNKLNEIKNENYSLKDKINVKISNEESCNNYNDIYYWKIENTLSNEVKERLESNINLKLDDNDDENELLNIAIKLERQENDKTSNKKMIILNKFRTRLIKYQN